MKQQIANKCKLFGRRLTCSFVEEFFHVKKIKQKFWIFYAVASLYLLQHFYVTREKLVPRNTQLVDHLRNNRNLKAFFI